MTKLGLTLNEVKTSVKDARTERFDFLGYAFGPHCYQRNGKRYLGASPSEKSVKRMKTKIDDVLVPGNVQPWTDVCHRLNGLLRGWSAYFCYGSRNRAYRAIDHHVCERVRHFLSRRHKVPSRGTKRFPSDLIFGGLGWLHQAGRVALCPSLLQWRNRMTDGDRAGIGMSAFGHQASWSK